MRRLVGDAIAALGVVLVIVAFLYAVTGVGLMLTFGLVVFVLLSPLLLAVFLAREGLESYRMMRRHKEGKDVSAEVPDTLPGEELRVDWRAVWGVIAVLVILTLLVVDWVRS